MSKKAPPPPPAVPLPSKPRGGERQRKPPRWTVAFLRALERCGEVRRAAADAAVDFSTAYARRRAHADFAAEWDAALAVFRERTAGAGGCPIKTADVAPGPLNHSASPNDPPPPDTLGEELTGEAAQLQPHGFGARMVRPAKERWTIDKERAFFAVLADRANVRAAARAAGVSTQAVYRRRSTRPEFRRQWDAAVETGKARLQMLLMDAAERTFDPELIEVSDEQPKISASEALRLLSTRIGKEMEQAGWEASPDELSTGEAEVAEVRAKIARKLDRLNEQINRNQRETGWSFDDEHQVSIPPGWSRSDSVAIVDGGPRGTAERACPHCGGGLRLA